MDVDNYVQSTRLLRLTILRFSNEQPALRPYFLLFLNIDKHKLFIFSCSLLIDFVTLQEKLFMSEQDLSVKYGLEHFQVSGELLKNVLATALENGGDYADLFFEHDIANEISLLDNKVDNASSNIDYGMGIRVVFGDQTGYAFVENITPENMLKAAKTASRIAYSEKDLPPINLAPQTFSSNKYPAQKAWIDTSVERKKLFLEKLNNRIFELDKRVIKCSVSIADGTSHVLFCNSDGVMYYDYVPSGSLMTMCVMADKGQINQGGASRSFRMGWEMMNDSLLEEVASEAVAHAAFLFEAVQPEGGEMPVVMGAGASGILLHEAIGHAFEADFNRKRVSIFSDKLGKKVCSKNINVVDDGTIPFNRGSINWDDEGVESQKTYIVRDGILNSYLHDRISAKYYGVAPTGNGRRESFRNIPIPRMRATYMENGNATQEDIIAQVKHGVFVDVFTNGQVQIGAGDFTFYVKSGYMIENGRLTQPIKDINIIGNGPQVLSDIKMVGNNFKIDNSVWTCGKNGQSCPVTCGMPSVLVEKLTVGGK